MKRFWTVLVVVAVALVMALPAGAVKPANPPGKPPADEPLVGLTCAEAEADGFDRVSVNWSADYTTFTVKIGYRENACVDVTSGAGDWKVDVDMGGALEVGMGVQDSVAPGDACWGGCAGGGVISESGLYSFYTPASIIDACNFDVKDPDFGDGDGQLTFNAWAGYRGNPKAVEKATITVILPLP